MHCVSLRLSNVHAAFMPDAHAAFMAHRRGVAHRAGLNGVAIKSVFAVEAWTVAHHSGRVVAASTRALRSASSSLARLIQSASGACAGSAIAAESSAALVSRWR